MGRSERREGAALYVEGLLLPGERKSIEPMAQRLGVDSQKLQQFVTDSPWDERAVWRVLRQELVPSLEPAWAWIVDETGWLKQGKHSVGVAHQYCGAVGKSANCQVNVQVAVTDGQVAVPVAARLYLPESWTEDRARCQAAGVPAEVKFATKPQIALELSREALADGLVAAPVLGDSVYGDNGEFRDGLRALGLEFFLQVDAAQLTGWAQPVAVVKKRIRWQVDEDQPPAKPLATVFAQQKTIAWRHCSWKAVDGQTRRWAIHNHLAPDTRYKQAPKPVKRWQARDFGALWQYDASPHHWPPDSTDKQVLLDILDDATRFNTGARLYERESLLAHFDFLSRVFQAHGLPWLSMAITIPSSTPTTPTPSPNWAPPSTSTASPSAAPPRPKPKAKSNAATTIGKNASSLCWPPTKSASSSKPMTSSTNSSLTPTSTKSTANWVPPRRLPLTKPSPKTAPPSAPLPPAPGGPTSGASKPQSALATTARSPSAHCA
jgi:hypothetical protein